MRFALTEEQTEFRDATRSMLEATCPTSTVRAAWDHQQPLEPAPWDGLSEMGVFSILVPESRGGMGLDENYLVPLLEEAGRVALPHPVIESATVAAPISGHPPGTVFATDLAGPVVANAIDAEIFLLRHETGLHAIPADAVELEPVESVDRARRAARVLRWDPGSGELVDRDPGTALARGTLGAAAFLVGLSGRMLELAVDHVRDRHQFGVPVGSFQAVKHQLADALQAVSFARPPVRRAAWALSVSAPSWVHDVAMAKVMAGEAAERVGRIALQCHGAMGYTVEHDLHLFLKRAWALRRAWGDERHHRDTVGRAIGV